MDMTVSCCESYVIIIFLFLIFAGFADVLAALLIHGLTWKVRLNYPALTVIGGALSALVLMKKARI